MTLERTKRYAAALLCAVGLSFLGNTVWAESGSGSGGDSGGTTFTWILADGSSEEVDEQEARTRCEQCQQGGNNNANQCIANQQMCASINIVFSPTITIGD